MTDAPSLTESDLYLPLLAAIESLGGEGHYESIDETALELAGATGQDAELGPPGERTPVAKRLGWARSNLKRVRALESLGSGVWGITDMGRSYLGQSPEAAVSTLQEEIRKAYALTAPDEGTLLEWRAEANGGDPKTMTARKLISFWNVNRRWNSVNQKIKATLSEYGLKTDPDFTSGGLDDEIAIIMDDSSDQAGPQAPIGELMEINALTVGNLPSAGNGVLGVSPSDELLRAQSLMQAHDFSQLAVMSGPRSLKGAISWESIARARLHNPAASLQDCLERPVVVEHDTPLLSAVPHIVKAGFVFVKTDENEISGLVTTADLSEQFAALTRPFLLVGEIEGVLRVAVDACFTPDELLEMTDPDDPDREIEAAHSMTLGELQRVMESRDAWERFGWHADRRVFVERLDKVRRVRNEITHFSPDPIASDDIEVLEHFLEWLRDLVRHWFGKLASKRSQP